MSSLDQCERLAKQLTIADQTILCERLARHFPSILTIGEDMLRLVCHFLEDRDKLTFLYAITCTCRQDAPMRLDVERFPMMTPLFLVELAVDRMLFVIRQLAENTLYYLPQREECFAVIASNWTPFKSRKFTPVAIVHWSQTPPHPQIIPNTSHIRRQVTSCLSAIRPVLRLSVHISFDPVYDWNHKHGTPVIIHHCQHKIETVPLAVHTLDLLDGVTNGLTVLYGKAFRSMIASYVDRSFSIA